MHTRSNATYLILAAASAILIAPPGLRTASADTTAAFAGFAGDVSLNSTASFNDSGLGGTGPLAFDPNNPDTLFAINRAAPPTPVVTSPVTPPGTGGIYPFSVSTQSRITNSSGKIFITANSTTSSATTMAWSSSTDPYDDVIGNDGSLYVNFYVSAGLYKISNPLSDSPTYTRMFAGYGGAGDDDAVNIFRMPATFGLANYTSNDLLILDNGLNVDNVNALSAVHADGSDGSLPTLVWKRSSTPVTGTIHGAVDPKSGYVYFMNTTPEHNTIDGSDYVIVNRVKGDGVLQTIGLKLPAGITLNNADDPIAINPIDGSLWLADAIITNNGDGTTTDTKNRTMLRVDTQYLNSTSDPNSFLANAITEFTATNFNMGVNSLTFTNDGKELYAGTPDGTDKLWVFNTLIHNPGDANGDGKVNADDYALLDRGFAAHLTGFTNGDFNSDGVIDQNDYLILDTTYLQAHPTDPSLLAERSAQFGEAYVSSLLASVPEPSSALLLLASFPLIQRRKRNVLP